MAVTNYFRGQSVFKGTVIGMAARKQFYPAQLNSVQTVIAAPTILFGYYIFNPNDSVCFVQFFDTLSVVLGTTAPAPSLGIPPGGGANLMSETGIAFDTAMKLAVTTTSTGNTAPAQGVDINVYYQ